MKVYLMDKHFVVHYDNPVDDLNYNEAVVQGVHFPAGPARKKTLAPTWTTTIVLADWHEYPESFFLNHEIEFCHREGLDVKIPIIVSLDSRG